MRYIVCDDCGGYYKLEPDESLEDFSECQCGGHLRYAQSVEEIIKNRDVSTKTCISCGARNRETDTTCSTCGEELRSMDRGRSGYSARKSGKEQVKSKKTRVKSKKAQVNILDRISFSGVLAGFIFLVLASIITVFGLAGSIVSTDGVDILRSLGGYLIVLLFAVIASGFVASYIGGASDYVDGLLNGGMVGLVLSVLAALFVMLFAMTVDVAMGILTGLLTLFTYLLVYGSLTALGGMVAVWVRNYMDDH